MEMEESGVLRGGSERENIGGRAIVERGAEEC